MSTAVKPLDDLRGRAAILTGAGKGLGRAYALHLASRGAAVLVNNRRHAGEADEQTSARQTVDTIRAALRADMDTPELLPFTSIGRRTI